MRILFVTFPYIETYSKIKSVVKNKFLLRKQGGTEEVGLGYG